MKRNFIKNLIYLIAILLFLNHPAIAQENKYESEILVYILPDSLELEEGIIETNNINNLKIKSNNLDKAIKKISFDSIEKAFPNFDERDTIKMGRRGKKIKLMNMSRIFKIKVKNKMEIESTISTLANEKSVLFAERNGGGSSSSTTPNDEYFGNQWGLKNGTSGMDINVTEAWDIYKGTSNNIIAIIDAGIDKSHPDLDGKVSGDNGFSAYDFVPSHGTHVAGIAAAKTNNNTIGVAGVSWYANLHSQNIDLTDDNGKYAAIIDAVDYSDDVYVLNNSWKLVNPVGRNSTLVHSAFAYAYKNDVVSVAAMGNFGNNTTHYPAGFKNCMIAVGATNSSDYRWSYSNYGNHIDVVAPGVGIYSTKNNNSYGYIDGTSMSTAFVSGLASLLKGYKPTLENDDIENIIKISADEHTSEWNQYYGHGRINAKRALDYLRAPYVLEQNYATWGNISISSGPEWIEFLGADDISDGSYYLYRLAATITVNVNSNLLDKHIWGRGVNTLGYSDENPNFGIGFCEVVSTTCTTATLRTYIYTPDPYAPFPSYIPAISHPMFITYEYSVLGYSAPQNLTVGESSNEYVLLAWDAYPKSDLKQYNIYRKGGYPFVDWTKIGTSSTNSYEDTEVTTTYHHGDDFFYKVTAVDVNDLESGYSNTVEIEARLEKDVIVEKNNEIPDEYALNSNYPNPFNPSTIISYQLPKNGFVSLAVYNTVGQTVGNLVNKNQTAGKYTVEFNAAALPSGVYFYRIQAGDYVSVKKMLLMK